MGKLGTSTVRRPTTPRLLLAVCVWVAAGIALPLPGAQASTGCSADQSFCIDHVVTASVPGTATAQTTAAAPADLALSLTNTAPNHRGTTALWLRTVSAQLVATAGDGAALTPSAQLPDNLLVAGSATDCPAGADYSFSTCTGGHGSALVYVSGTGYIDGVHDATFGIQRVVNVNPPTVAGAVTQLTATYSLCVSTPLGPCSPQQTAQATLSIGAPAGAPAPLTLDVTSSFTFSAYGATATADGSLDSLSLAVQGISSTLGTGAPTASTYQVTRLPRVCGAADGTGTAMARGGAVATVPLGFTITGCPDLTGLSSTQTAPFSTTLSSTATTPVGDRSIAAWRWDFGDGATARTASGTTSHAYTTSVPRTITVVAEDSAGAVSAPRTLALNGVSLTETVTPATTTYGAPATVSGVLTDATSHAGLAGRTISVSRCRTDRTGCTLLGNVTTAGSSSAGRWSLKVTPSAAASFAATYAGGPGYLGTTSFAAVGVRTSMTLTANHVSVRTGGSVTLSGKVSPAHPGQAVAIQRYVNGVWVTIANRTLTGASTFSYSFTATPRGPLYFQVVKSADADHVAATSHPVIVTAT
jgi:hypothetical protein